MFGVDSTELATLDTLLARRFGPVVHATPEYHVYGEGTVALRFKPPEVLVATPQMSAELTGYRAP